MTIEIHTPELEALIMERITSGEFQNVEELLMRALAPSPEWKPKKSLPDPESRTGADLIAAMQSSPSREIEIEPARYRLPVRQVTF